MRKFISILMLLMLPCFTVFGADTKVTALTADTAPDGADLIMTVDDVAGTPTSKKVTLTNVWANALPMTFAANAETVSNATDDVLIFGSNDESMTLRALGFEAKAANFDWFADQDDDATDGWRASATTSGTWTLANDTSVAGTMVTKLTVDGATGDVTLTGDIINENADSLLMNTDDILVYTSNDESATIRALGFEAKAAQWDLLSDQDDDATDGWRGTATTSGTFTLANDSGVAGTFVTKLTVDGATGNVSLVGDLSGDGADQFYGFLQDQVASTTVAITAAQCGKTFVSDSADVMTLPEASTVLGCRYSFVAGTADDFDIDPADATDEFGRMSVDGAAIDGAAGDEYRLTDIGSSMTIEAVGNDIWAVIAHNGPITDVD